MMNNILWSLIKTFYNYYIGLIQRRKTLTHIPEGVGGLAFNTNEWPFDDIRVRKAFTYLQYDMISFESLYSIPSNTVKTYYVLALSFCYYI